MEKHVDDLKEKLRKELTVELNAISVSRRAATTTDNNEDTDNEEDDDEDDKDDNEDDDDKENEDTFESVFRYIHWRKEAINILNSDLHKTSELVSIIFRALLIG